MANQEDLLAVVQLFRHGKRTPLFCLPGYPYSLEDFAPLEYSVLTPKGMLQEYNLGQSTRKRYSNFLPSIYSKNDFLMYSTGQDTTLQSAQMFTAGLYPPTEVELWSNEIKWRPIPVRMADNCLVMKALHEHANVGLIKSIDVKIIEYLEENSEKLKKLCQYVSEHLDITVEDPCDLAILFDSSWSAVGNGFKLPEWLNKIYDSIGKVTYDMIRVQYAPDESKRIFGGPIFNEIYENFKKKSSKPAHGPKLTSYACHDHNMISVFELLGIKDYDWPSTGSTAYFELHKKENGPYINIFFQQYDGDVVPLTVPGKSFDISFEEYESFFGKYFVTPEEVMREARESTNTDEPKYKSLFAKYMEQVARRSFKL